MNNLLITATDTDAGKTIITTALRAYYQVYFPHVKTGLMKLLQTGIEGDAEFYGRFFDDAVIPLRYNTPVAPPIASEKENKSIDLATIWHQLQKLSKTCDLVLIEGIGGLGCPLTHELTIADIAGTWRLESILVVPVKLGSIGHTVANVALARQQKIKLKGIIFNCVNPCSKEDINNWTPKDLIESLTQLPVLGYFPYLERIDNLQYLAEVVAEYLYLSNP